MYPMVSLVDQADKTITHNALILLLKLADKTGDMGLLNYSVGRMNENPSLKVQSELVSLKKAELLMNEKKIEEALSYYLDVNSKNSKNKESLYNLGYIYSSKGEFKKAYIYFTKLLDLYEQLPDGNYEKGLATISTARLLYQAKMWEQAIAYYADIPRNHPLYRTALFEMSWAQFRSGRFRAAASTTESLLSSFYDHIYDPEALLLRMTIHLYMCHHEDLDKSISTYEKNYLPIPNYIRIWQQKKMTAKEILKLISEVRAKNKLNRENLDIQITSELPYFLVDTILRAPEVKKYLDVISAIKKEREVFRARFKTTNKKFIKFSEKIYLTRISLNKQKLLSSFESQLNIFLVKQEAFNTQFELMKYEALETKKNLMKSKLSAASRDKNQSETIEKRDFYLQNGYRFWPFRSEYWVDEIGNFQYIGNNKCIEEE